MSARESVPDQDTAQADAGILVEEASMKSAANRELFNYWNACRGRSAAPERHAIEPGAIRSILPDTFILNFDRRLGHPFRLAGTRVCAIFGRELKGQPLLGLWHARERERTREIVDIVAEEPVGVAIGVTAHAQDDSRFELELLILPLRHDGQMGARLLGALVPTERPYWLGTRPVENLSLGALRYLGAETEDVPTLTAGKSIDTPMEPRRHAGAEPAIILTRRPLGRERSGLVIYDGGRSD